MANRSTYPLVDRLFDGGLERSLRFWRVKGFSHEKIARLIEARTEHPSSATTVRRWCTDLGIDQQKAA
jgi:hypothetical protein